MLMKKCTTSNTWKDTQQRSIQTWNNKKQRNIELYMQHPKRCKHCDSIIEYDDRRKTFCNHSCSASFNNKGKVKNGISINSKRKYKCLNCTLLITRGIYCSTKCQGEFKTKQSIKKWKLGNIKRSERIPSYIRTYLMELHNSSCELCGWDKKHPITGNVPLQIDHIDGDCCNHLFENLQLICPSCHSLTPNYGGLNRGNSTRCKRYK